MQAFPRASDAGDELVFDKGMDILLTLDRQFPRFDVGEDFFKPFVDRPSVRFGNNAAPRQHFRVRKRGGNVRPIELFVERERFVERVRVRRRRRGKPAFP